MPVRIQRKRTKGWRMPDGAVYVGRPSRFGNPYNWRSFPSDAVPEKWAKGAAVDLFRDHVRELRPMIEEMRRDKARGFRWDWCTSGRKYLDGTPEREAMVELVSACEHGALRGKDLVCWCQTDQPCHADVLLELANE